MDEESLDDPFQDYKFTAPEESVDEQACSKRHFSLAAISLGSSV